MQDRIELILLGICTVFVVVRLWVYKHDENVLAGGVVRLVNLVFFQGVEIELTGGGRFSFAVPVPGVCVCLLDR